MKINDWNIIFKQGFIDKINTLYENTTVYPCKNDTFNAMKYTSLKNVKVVIIGQDPYHGENQANGLSFSVNENIKLPPSLKNIFKELEHDLGIKRTSGNLKDWAEQGVLLLNSILTVEKDKPLSHENLGWEEYTDNIIQLISKKKEPVIFILWGSFAKKKKTLITNKNHLVLESVHPSPLSAYRGFFGSKPFSKANNFLEKNNTSKINW